MKSKKALTLVGIAFLCLLILCCITSIATTQFKINMVQGQSMNPTLEHGDYIIGVKKKPKSGDLVVYKYQNSLIINRVVGAPGDEIEFKNAKVYVNGNSESYSDFKEIPETTFPASRKLENKFIIEDGTYLLLGDNRKYSFDSRSIGLVSKDAIQSVTIYISK